MEKKERYNIEKKIIKEKSKKKNIVYIFLSAIMLILFSSFYIIILRNIKSEDEPIIYGEIDETIEYNTPSIPKIINNNGNFYGNNYFNLYQNSSKEMGIVSSNGNFTYDDEFYYYSLFVDNKHIVLKENIENQNKEIIYTGSEINNLLNINGWIYGIKRDVNGDSIIYFDINGNSIKTKDFNSKIITLISDGENLYYTSEAMPYIYKIDLLLKEIEIVTSCERLIEYPELLYMEDYIIYFTDFNGLYSYDLKTKTKEILTNYITQKSNSPYFSTDNIFFIDNKNKLNFNNVKYKNEISAISMMHGNIIFSEKNYLYSIDMIEGFVYNIMENEFDINSIYVTKNAIIISDGTNYKKIEGVFK